MIINVFQLGIGNVGKVVIEKILNHNAKHKTRINLIGLADSKSCLFNSQGLSRGELKEIVKNSFKNINIPDQNDLDDLFVKLLDLNFPVTIIDTTATEKVTPFLLKCADSGFKLVLANKKPLVDSYEIFQRLTKVRLGCRATVGAGLPVIPKIKKLINQGENIRKIEGCFSGSMGILASELEKKRDFSEIINEAVVKGYTEPDPRIDLSGVDLANKILIQSRIAGKALKRQDTIIEKLYSPKYEAITKEEFLKRITEFNEYFKSLYQEASTKDETYRYLASFENEKCRVSFKKVSKNSEFGKLQNAGKLAIITTDKGSYVIKGQGSGAQSAAQDVLDDLLEINSK